MQSTVNKSSTTYCVHDITCAVTTRNGSSRALPEFLIVLEPAPVALVAAENNLNHNLNLSLLYAMRGVSRAENRRIRKRGRRSARYRPRISIGKTEVVIFLISMLCAVPRTSLQRFSCGKVVVAGNAAPVSCKRRAPALHDTTVTVTVT